MLSSQRGEFGRSGSTHTDLAVLNRLVSDGVLAEEVSDHFGFDFDWSPGLAGVDIDD